MPNGEEEKEKVAAPVLDIPEYDPTKDVDLGGITIPDYNPAQDVQLGDLPPTQEESQEYGNLLSQQLLEANNAFAAPETSIPQINQLTIDQLDQREEAFRQKNQQDISFFDEFSAEKDDRDKFNQPIPSLIPIDKSLQEDKEIPRRVIEQRLFTQDVENHRTYALEHIKRFDPERFKALQKESDEGKLTEEDEISLVNEGIRLKAEALRLKFDEVERRTRSEAEELVSSDEFEQLTKQAGIEAETIEDQVNQVGEVTDLGLSLSDEAQVIAEELNTLEEQSDTFVQKEYPKTAAKILDNQIKQDVVDALYVIDPEFRQRANTSNLIIRSISDILKDLANVPGVDAVLTPVVDKFSDDNKEEFSEIVAGWVDSFNDLVAPIPTRLKEGRALFEEQAEVTVDGEKLDVIFEQDKVVDVRFKDGRSISGELAQKAVDEYDANPTEITSPIDEGLIIPRMTTSLTEISLLIGGARAVTRGLSALGAAEATAKVGGLFTTNFVLMNDGFYREARGQGLSDTESAIFSAASAVTATAVMLLNPGKFIFGREFVTKFTKQYADILTKGVSTRQALQETFKSGTKEALNFNLFVGSLALADNTTKYITNKLTGQEAFDFEITSNQIKEDLIINTLTGFLIGVNQGRPSNQVSRLQKDALFSAVIEKDVFIPRLTEKIRDGEIDKATGEQLIAKIQAISTKIGNIPQDITIRDKSEMLTLMEERIRLKVQAQDADLGEAFKKANEVRIEEIDTEMTKIINKEPVEAEKPAEEVVKEKKPTVELKELEKPTPEKFGEIVEVDVEGKETRRETLTEEQFKAEQTKQKEVEPEVPAPKPPEAKEIKEIKRIDAEIEAERTKIEEQKKLEEPDAEAITASEVRIKELEAEKVTAEPVKEVKTEEITREDEVVDTKIKTTAPKETVKAQETEKKKIIKEEGEPLEETEVDKDVKKLEESDTVDEISQIDRDLKEEKLNSPQDFADRINKTIDNIRKAQAVGAPELLALRDISDKVLTDIQKKVETAKDFEGLKEQFKRIESEIEQAASKEIQGRLLNEVKKELKLSKAETKKLSPQVNSELKRFKAKSSFKNPEELKAQRLQKTSEWFMENPGQPIPERIVRELEELDKTNLTLLSNRELKNTLDDIRLLKTQGKTFNRLKLARTERERNKRIDEFNNDITEGKGVEKKKRVLPEVEKKLKQKFADAVEKVIGAALTPLLATGIVKPKKPIKSVKAFLEIPFFKKMLNTNNMFDIIEQQAKGTLYEGRFIQWARGWVNKARDAELFGTNNKVTRIQAKLTELNLGSTINEVVEIKGEKISKAAMIDIFVSRNDPAKLASIKDMKSGNRISQEFIDKVVNELTPEEKAFGNWVLDWYDGELYNEFNDVYRQITFTDAPKNEGYSPMIKKKNFINRDEGVNLSQMNFDYAKASTFKPFTKERVGSKAAIELDILKTLTEYITRTEHYKAFELPLQEMNATIKGIKDAVIQEHGREHFDLLERWARDVASDGRYKVDDIGKMLRGLRLGFTKGVLGFNLVTAIKQTVSLSSFLTEISEVDMTKGLIEYWNPKKKKQWDEFMDTIGALRFRAKRMERDIADVDKSRTDLDKIFNVHKLGDKSLGIIRGMDRLTVRSGFVAAYKAKGGKLGEPINEKALSFATGLIERTQPRGDIKDLSAFQKGSELTKLLTMFMNQPNQYFNVMYANINAYNQGRIGRKQLARSLFYSWIVPSIVFETISRGGTPDEDDIISAVTTAPLRNIFFLSSIVESMRTGFDFKASPVESIPADMIREAQNFNRGEVAKGLYGLAFLTAKAKGLPVTQLERSVEGTADILSGKTDDWRRLIWSDWALRENNNAGGMQIQNFGADENYDKFIQERTAKTFAEQEGKR